MRSHRAALRNLNVIFQGLERLESAGAFPPRRKPGCPYQARAVALGPFGTGHLATFQATTCRHSTRAVSPRLNTPWPLGLSRHLARLRPAVKAGDRSSPPASWSCHQCKNVVTARSTRLDSIVTMLATYPPRRWPCGPRLWKTRTDARRALAALSGFPTGPHRG